MNLANYVIIQTALKPMTVVSIHDTDYSKHEVANFAEFFAVMNNSVSITKDTIILVNRGPGSYSGIRTGIAYVLGLLHGRLITDSQIHSFTSFDLVRATSSHKEAIYLKAWPRIASGKLEESKGYFQESPLSVPVYRSWDEIKDQEKLFIVSDEEIQTTHEKRTYTDLLEDPVGYRSLAAEFEKYNNDLDPLYINPVHIS